MSGMTCKQGPDHELRNAPDAPMVDEVEMRWDNCDRWSLSYPDGTVKEPEDFGCDTGASIQVAVSRDGDWVLVCIDCKAEGIPHFGLCPACQETQRRRYAAGNPF